METKEIEDLFVFQDTNKLMRFNSISAEQIKQTELIEINIQDKFKKIYI